MSDEQTPAEARDEAADLRDDAAEARDDAARVRDEVAADRDTEARVREETAEKNRISEAGRLADRRQRDDRAGYEEDRRRATADDAASTDFLTRLRQYESLIAADRRAAAEDRRAAAEDRRAAAHDRQLAAWARQQAAVESAEMTADELTGPSASSTPASQVGEAPHAAELGQARRSGIEHQSAAVKSAQYAADLAGAIAESEQRVALTMRRLAAHGGSTATARRLELADQATTGMRVATERGDRLRELAERANDDLMTSALRSLLRYACASYAALAETERSIAGAWDLLAARLPREAAATYRREATRAAASAAVVARRAQELRAVRLEVTSRAAREPDEPGEGTSRHPDAQQQPGQ